jgi:hypothetical protein
MARLKTHNLRARNREWRMAMREFRPMVEAAGYTFVPYLEYRKTIQKAFEVGMDVPDHMIWPELNLKRTQ